MTCEEIIKVVEETYPETCAEFKKIQLEHEIQPFFISCIFFHIDFL